MPAAKIAGAAGRHPSGGARFEIVPASAGSGRRQPEAALEHYLSSTVIRFDLLCGSLPDLPLIQQYPRRHH